MDLFTVSQRVGMCCVALYMGRESYHRHSRVLAYFGLAPSGLASRHGRFSAAASTCAINVLMPQGVPIVRYPYAVGR